MPVPDKRWELGTLHLKAHPHSTESNGDDPGVSWGIME